MTSSLTLNDNRGLFLPDKVFSNLRNLVFSHFALVLSIVFPPHLHFLFLCFVVLFFSICAYSSSFYVDYEVCTVFSKLLTHFLENKKRFDSHEFSMTAWQISGFVKPQAHVAALSQIDENEGEGNDED